MPDPITYPYRLTFATCRTLAYVSVLELGIIWERCLRRAALPLKYSQGFNPRPRMAFAAPLPVGCGGDAELLDVQLTRAMEPDALLAAVRPQTPRDLALLEAAPLAPDAPPLVDLLLAAEYRVWLREVRAEALQEAVAAFLSSEVVLAAKRSRHHRGAPYDLRALVECLSLTAEGAPDGEWVGLAMRLTARPGATGRPDEVLKALGLYEAPRRCIRTRLILAQFAIQASQPGSAASNPPIT